MSDTHRYQCPKCLRYIHVLKSQPKTALEYCSYCNDLFSMNDTNVAIESSALPNDQNIAIFHDLSTVSK